ncbi:MAG: methyltransferase domain-containing protein [Chloroflexi bacterium]|nr:methyltransferase domain-containing protein [Chloroflexota bacterium]
MKKVAIIQARLTSSRLPGKVLLDVGGEPMLARVISRVRQAQLVDEIVVATSSDFADDPIMHFCQERKISCCRGDAYDVLDRFYECARAHEADLIIRITADCPMIAPEEIDRVIQAFLDSGADFAANRLPPPFERSTPIGMDTEVCSMSALERAWKEAKQPYQREHVMPYLYDTPGRFKVQVVDLEPSQGHLRFTVDTPEDLELANQVFAAFEGRDDFSLAELLAENERHPEWQDQVAQVRHKNLYETDSRAASKLPVCPLCASPKSKNLEKVESFGFPLQYLICQDCGFVFQDPHTNQAADPQFYQETYRQIYQSSAEPTSKDLYQQRQRALNQAGWLKSLGYTSFDSLLDIGASAGLLLVTFAREFGAKAAGVEPGDAYRALAEGRGIAMFESLEGLLKTEHQRFELVSLMHVLEHLDKPLDVLRQIRDEMLAEDGLLLIEVPNFYAHDSYELAHLSCFTEHTLLELLQQAGFEKVAFRQHGMPRSRILPLYLSVLAKPAKTDQPEPVAPEKNVTIKRKLGMLRRKVLSRLNPTTAWLPLERKQ